MFLLFYFSAVVRFDASDVDCFSYTPMTDSDCSIVVDLCDAERASRGCVHLWLTLTFISVEDDENLVSWRVCFGEAGLVFFVI